MKLLKTSAYIALTLTCATATIASQASAATLLDFLRGGKETKKGDVLIPNDQLDNSLDPNSLVDKPLPKVKAPRYFTYKPDALQLVKVAKFAPAGAQPAQAQADVETTGSVQTVSTETVDVSANPRAYMIDAKVRAGADVAAAIEKFYASREGLLWVDANGVTDKARAALGQLAKADAVGLDPADYAVVDPTDTFAGVDAVTRQRQLMQFEIELSAAALTFIQDTKRGRIDPNKISEYHDFKRKTVNLDAAMMNIAVSPDVAAYLDSRNPSDPDFEALRQELAILKGATEGEAPKVVINLTGLIRPGDNNPELANVIAGIREKGSDKLKVDHSVTLSTYSGDSVYGDDLVALVKDYQTENGLKPDGIIGRGTVKTLTGGDTAGDKIAKVIIAMEQRRWMSADLGTRYVFINQPAFMAYYHQDNKEQFSMGVVVGSPRNQTFFFQDEVETVEYNPYWGVPRSIIVNEMLPKLRQDPSYLDRLGYEVSVNGQQTSSTAIDWYSTDSVDVRQPPGNGNALGQLKILFPNTHSIYMHDTPQKKFFARDMRALSHGCVRLSDPKKMAAAVMGTTIEEIDAQIAIGQNHAEKVPVPFPVYVSYFTAWPNKDGVVEYFDDVYGRDDYTKKAFEATSKVRRAEI